MFIINIKMINDGSMIPKSLELIHKADDKAKKVVQSAFPDKKIITINGIDISMGGGNVHCITQQQPQSI